MSLARGLLVLGTSIATVFAGDEAVVFVVDPSWDCTASYVANTPLLKNYKIIKVMTHMGVPYPCADSPDVDLYMNITYNSFTPNDADAAADICPMLKNLGFPVAAVLPTFDPATYLADRLAACVGVRGNPFEGPLAHARFDKWVMSESVRNAGLRAVKERVFQAWPEAQAYLESLDPPVSTTHPVVLKVPQSSDSEGVFKCYNIEQAEATFKAHSGKKTIWGDTIVDIIIQECFMGKEYVVDSVSRDGVHKTVVVWNEDLRPRNGFSDFYYGFKIQNPEDEKTKAIINYANKVLDAVGVKNGASDMEIFWVDDENQPCVTDMNARWGALMWQDGLNLLDKVTGHNQVIETFNALLDEDAFNAMPSVYSINAYAAVLFVLPFQTGVITGIPGLPLATHVPSFWHSYNEGLYEGKVIEHLYNTKPAIYFLLAHEDPAVISQDYDFIVGLENSYSFFTIAPFPTSVASDEGKSRSYKSQAIAALAMTVAAVVWAVRAKHRRRDGHNTDYLLAA